MIDGYRIEKSLDASGLARCHLGVRASDGLAVVLKCATPDAAGVAVAALRSEYALLKRVAGPGLPVVVELALDQKAPVLVMQKARGVPAQELEGRGPMAISAFLDIALRLARAVDSMHSQGVMHCRIAPSHCIVDLESEETTLIGLGHAQPIGAHSSRTDLALGEAAEAVAYMAPELTGRMARSADGRSDLYALGATLYALLVGERPFELDDPLALIHAHMARIPQSAISRRPDVPRTLSNVLDKLLRKEPSDRYQTARGLLHDLSACRDQWRESGSIDAGFELGRADAPEKPRFATQLYGREREQRVLREALGRTLAGSLEVVLLSGPAGVGKSALLQAMRGTSSERGVYFLQGKFDAYQNEVPYAALVSALESLVQQILGESEERLLRWREILSSALGRLSGAVAQLVPDVALVLGSIPKVPRLGPAETQARLVHGLERLVEACRDMQQPLVLLIDDLQWADPASRSVLESLTERASEVPLLVLATLRDVESDPESGDHRHAAKGSTEDRHGADRHIPNSQTQPNAAIQPNRAAGDWEQRLRANGVSVEHLRVAPLELESTTRMLCDALGTSLEVTLPLAECVAIKTGNNPFWIRQFVEHAQALGCLRFEAGQGWVWSLDEIASIPISDGAVGLLVEKLERLDEELRRILVHSACVGDRVDTELLSEWSAEPVEGVEARMFALVREGLLVAGAGGFRFAHDRVREASLSLLPSAAQADLHHRLGLLLLERNPLASTTDLCFEIADHLNRAPELLREAERPHAFQLNVAAGDRALRAGASRTAYRYLSEADSLFLEDDWARDPRHGFSFFIQFVEAALQVGELETAGRLLQSLESREVATLERAQVAAKRISLLLRHSPKRACAATVEALRALGESLPARPSYPRVYLMMRYVDWCLRGRIQLSSFGCSPTQGTDWLGTMIVMGAGGPALMRGGSALLLCAAISRSVLRFIRHGAVPGMSLSFAAYAAARIGILGNVRGTRRYVDATRMLMERLPSPYDVRAKFSLLAFTLPYLEPRRSLVDELRQVASEALEMGDPEYATYTSVHRWASLALLGEPLDRVLEEGERIMATTRHASTRVSMEASVSAYSMLRFQGGAARRDARSLEELRDLIDSHGDGNVSIALHWFAVFCYCGRFRSAEALRPYFGLSAFAANPAAHVDYGMLRAICTGALCEQSGFLARYKAAWSLDLLRIESARRTQENPDFVHMNQVIRAEIARLRGRASNALLFYQQAAQRASERGYPHHAALILERRASLLMEKRRKLEGAAALRSAIGFYEQWGALARVRELEAGLRDQMP